MLTVSRGMKFVSYVLAGAGAFLIIRETSPMVCVGIILMIWGNNVYEASR